MASIVKRKNKYCVIYYFKNGKGERKQKWGTYNTFEMAKKRKAQVEYEKAWKMFKVRESVTVCELLDEFVNLYGTNAWSASTYRNNIGIIDNYILPLLGEVKIDDINTHMIDGFYRELMNTRFISANGRKPSKEYLSTHVIREIHKLLRCAFNQAVRWELLLSNPCQNAIHPKEEHKSREIWDAETLFRAIELCDDSVLRLALNLAFCCSLRIGELLGLTWDCIDIEESNILSGRAYLFINKELQRVNKDVTQALRNKDILFTFPDVLSENTTSLVLKKPKTNSSIRKVFIPPTVARMLKERYDEIQTKKAENIIGYKDYDLVFCSSFGRPMEGHTINKALSKLIKEKGLPPVVFHSLRHTSITYKLKLNGGDIKSVQGDSGHAQTKMITDVYSHILDEDRRINAQRFEEAFYQKKPTTDEELCGKKREVANTNYAELIVQLLANPNMCGILKQALNSK